MADRKVFISYSHKDKDAVKSLLEALKNQNVEYWSDQEIRAGEEWMQKLENALFSASIIILCISADFLASDWAMFEMGFALMRQAQSRGTVILPILLRPVSLPGFLQHIESIDASSLKPSSFAEQIEQLVEGDAA